MPQNLKDFVGNERVFLKLGMNSSKNAQMHIEVILAFLLFIGAVLVIFVFLNPLIKTTLPIPDINEIQEKIIEEISENVSLISVIIAEDSVAGCYDFNLTYTSVYGTEYTEVQLDARKYVLYFSDSLDDFHPNHNPACEVGKHKFGIHREEDLILYTKIETLVAMDYEVLRTLLQIDGGFKVTFKYLDRIIIPGFFVDKSIPQGVEVNAQEFPVRVIMNNGDTENWILNVQVW